jgi:hypothetical protein
MDGIRFPNERHSVLITSNCGNQKADSRQAQLFNGGWEWLDLTRIFALQLSVTPGVGHNLYAAAYAAVISRRVPPFVRSWLIVSTEYFQEAFIIIFDKNDTTQ